MLVAALVLVGVAIVLGVWLAAAMMIRQEPLRRIPWAGVVHGGAGAACVGLLLVALQGPRRGVHTGAGGFGWVSFAFLASALAGGATVLSFHLRRRGAPTLLIAAHAMLGMAGGILLAAWWASPASPTP